MLNLDAVLEPIKGVPVALIGDLMLDRFVYGSVDRISPESPVPVMNFVRQQEMLGGVGNVARNLAALGAQARLAALVGADTAARRIADLVAASPGCEAQLVIDEDRPTTEKTRYVAGGQQLLRLDVEQAFRPKAAALERLSQALNDAGRGARAVLVSDYAKGAIGESVLAACHALHAQTGAPILVDPKGQDLHRYGPVFLIKPNAKELALATGLPTGADEEVEAALNAGMAISQAQSILVTRAGAGMSLITRNGEVRHFRGTARQVFDVSGAGDTALAALGAALAVGAPLETAVAFALLASGVVVEKLGTAVVSPAELRQAQRLSIAQGPTAKIVDREVCADEARAWQDAGLKVGFTNGCFDVLHRGHVSYLDQARRACDRLIVGLNTDESVRALKGPGRPVNDLESRALVLASLSSVDLVTPFSEPDPLALIEKIRPDRLMKGADYTVDQVVGADLVLSYGGEVSLVPLVEGYSTTAALERWRTQT